MPEPDVSIEEGWPGVIEATERRFGPLNMANAGIGILCKAIEMSLADWRRQTAVNRDGVFLSVKYAVPAKGGVRLFAKAVAVECAAEGDGIRINTVPPRCHRYANLDKDIEFRRPQRADLTRTRCLNRGYRSAGLGRHRISPTASCSSLRRRPIT